MRKGNEAGGLGGRRAGMHIGEGEAPMRRLINPRGSKISHPLFRWTSLCVGLGDPSEAHRGRFVGNVDDAVVAVVVDADDVVVATAAAGAAQRATV